MQTATISFDKDAFERYGMWVLDPCRLIDNYGRIDFSTIKFYDDDKEIHPEGGGKCLHLNIPDIYHDMVAIREFFDTDLLPDPWLICIQTVKIEFELRHDKE